MDGPRDWAGKPNRTGAFEEMVRVADLGDSDLVAGPTTDQKTENCQKTVTSGEPEVQATSVGRTKW